MSIVNKKKLYLCQFSIIVEKQFVLLPYSVASVWAYAKQDNIVNHNYDLSADIFFIKKPIEQMMFINLCNEYCVEPYLVLDDLREDNKQWYNLTLREVKTFLNERY